MAILSVTIDSIGETGQVPKFIYIQTNDDNATVTSAGYLNILVSQGYALADYQMALVSTKDNPNDRATQTDLYNVVNNSGDWSLETPGSASGNAWLLGGNTTPSTQIFGTLNGQSVSFRANNVPYMELDVANDRLDIMAANVQAFSTGLISMTGETAVFDAVTAVGLGAIAATEVTIGNNNNPTNECIFNVPILRINDIPNTVQADVLYRDPSTGNISYGPFGSAGSWLTAGNTEIGLLFGTITSEGWSYVANNTIVGGVDAAGQFNWSAGFGFASPDTVILRSGGTGVPPPYTPGSFVIKSAALVSTIAASRNQMLSDTDCWVTAQNGQCRLDGSTININGSGGNTEPDSSNVYIHSDAGNVRLESEVGILQLIGGASVLLSGDVVTLSSNTTLTINGQVTISDAVVGLPGVGTAAGTPQGAPTNSPPTGFDYLVIGADNQVYRFPFTV